MDPAARDFQTISPCLNVDHESLMVSDLLTPAGSWNIDLINSAFSLVDSVVICILPVSSTGVEDKLFWHYDRFGRYTTKSGYKVDSMIQEGERNGGSGTSLLGS